MKEKYVCPACGASHEHRFFFCQTCEADMELPPGKFEGVTLDMPRHFTEANKGGYTQRELHRENTDKWRADEGNRKIWAV